MAFATVVPALVVSCGGRSELWIDDVLDSAAPSEEASIDASPGSPDAAAREASPDVTLDAPPDTSAVPDVATHDATTLDASTEAGFDAASDGGAEDASDASDAATVPDADGSCPTIGPEGVRQFAVSPAPNPFSNRSLAVQPDGKMLVYGFPDARPVGTVLLARYDVDGTLDPTFGTAGVATLTPHLASNWPNAIALQSDGRIVVATTENGTGSSLERVTAAGVLDTTFGVGGYAVVEPGAFIFDVAARPDGTIVATGAQGTGVYVARFTSTGAADTSFGAGGSTNTSSPTPGQAGAYRVAFQADGRIIVGGRTIDSTATGGAGLLVGYTANGALDTTFGNGGFVEPVNVPGVFYDVNDLLVQSTGAIVTLTGADWTSDARTFVLQRFSSTGVPDTTFGTNGTTVTNFFGIDVLPLAGDEILVGGTLFEQGVYSLALQRYTSSGALDPSFADGGMGVASFPGETTNWFRGMELGPQGIVFDGQGTAPSTDGGGAPLLDLGPFACP